MRMSYASNTLSAESQNSLSPQKRFQKFAPPFGRKEKANCQNRIKSRRPWAAKSDSGKRTQKNPKILAAGKKKGQIINSKIRLKKSKNSLRPSGGEKNKGQKNPKIRSVRKKSPTKSFCPSAGKMEMSK